MTHLGLLSLHEHPLWSGANLPKARSNRPNRGAEVVSEAHAEAISEWGAEVISESGTDAKSEPGAELISESGAEVRRNPQPRGGASRP